MTNLTPPARTRAGTQRLSVVTIGKMTSTSDATMPRAVNAAIMTSDAFVCWLHTMQWTHAKAAQELGLSMSRIDEMLRGAKRGTNTPTTIPAYMSLACAALAEGLPPFAWDEEKGVMPPEDFERWRAEMGRELDLGKPVPFRQIAGMLRLSSVETPAYWARGVRRDGKPAPIYRDRALALNALLHGLMPWTAER